MSSPLPTPTPPHDDRPGARHSPEEVVEHVVLPEAPRPRARSLVLGAALVLAGAGVLFTVGLLPRLTQAQKLKGNAAETGAALPRVEVVTPRTVSASRTTTLPGSVEPLHETAVYARASGYVRRWRVDLGDEVKEGQVLLELDTPELDQELLQARAAQAQTEAAVALARARWDLSKATAARYEKLGPTGVASQQEVEEKRTQVSVDQANIHAAEAAVGSARATVNRYVELKSFAKVTAPYAGRITTRSVEVGQLVNAGSAGGPGLFTLAQVQTVRVFLHVPQDLAASVKQGQRVNVTVRELNGPPVEGTVTHTAGALDARSRTLLVEVQLPNPTNAILAGMYAQVELSLSEPRKVLRLPATSLLVGAQGARVGTVDGASKLHFVPVVIGEDRGLEVDVLGGLTGEERVVVNVPEGAEEGDKVEVLARKA
jgi:RND family efflux transporter MFP subunit